MISPFRLPEITDPAKFEGGTLTMKWYFIAEDLASITIPLDHLTPMGAYGSADIP